MLKLSNRLINLVKLVDENQIVADIGTDHGLLPCYLAANKISSKIYAMDLRVEPLEVAKKNITKYGLINSVIPILSDGLDMLPSDVTTITISGLGSNLIVDICQRNLPLLKNKTLIFGPNCDESILREFLLKNNFKIVAEQIVNENEIFYEQIKAIPGSMSLTSDEITFGPILLKNKDSALFREKWLKELGHLCSVLLEINNFSQHDTINKTKVEKKIANIKEILQ
jgi:tRNA (adenine22-N1)-methyltransferase